MMTRSLRCHWWLCNPQPQVYERIKTPLLTLAASCAATPEVSYAVWGHLHLLVLRAPVLFSNEYKQFFCRASDSFAVKALKLEMLTVVADNNNTCAGISRLLRIGKWPRVLSRQSARMSHV